MNAVKQPPRQPAARESPDFDPTDPEPPGIDLGELVERHQASVWRYLRYLGAQSAEADDLTQETFLATARGDFRHENENKTTAYLRRVAHNQLRMLRRKQRRETVVADIETADAVWVERTADAWDDQIAAVRDCVERLEGRSREAVDLHYRDKAGREAIAQRLGMKPDGVKTLLRRARAALRDCVERALRAE